MGLRAKVVLPLILVVLLLVIVAVASRSQGVNYLLLGLAALLTLLAVFNVEVLLMRRLQRLRQLAQELRRSIPASVADSPPAGDFAETEGRLTEVRDAIKDLDTRLAHETSQRQKLERALHEIEERYVLAVERANDGLWEWDLRAATVEFSPRWKGMLGYPNTAVRDIEDWKKLIHPMDRDGVLMRLDNHIDGLTPYFDTEYRVKHWDGHYRWVHSRGTAIRHASGKPYRIVVMDNDIHARKQAEDTLIQAAEGLSAVSGMDFFQALMKNLAAILGTRDNLVCYCLDDPPTRVRTLAYYSNGKFWDNFDYELDGTSCGAVIARKETVYVPTGVCNIWPLEKQYDRDSYIGVPLFDSNGKLIGHFACMDGKPMSQDLPHLAIFKIFSVRAAVELERTMLKQKLEMM